MKVLIAVDNSEESIDAAHTAYKLFGGDADYTVASIGPNPAASIPASPMGAYPTMVIVNDELENSEHLAAEAAKAAKAELPTDTTMETEIGPVGSGICAIAQDIAADVVVIGSHDRGIWDRLFHPSVGRYLIDHAPCPVLIVR